MALFIFTNVSKLQLTIVEAIVKQQKYSHCCLVMKMIICKLGRVQGTGAASGRGETGVPCCAAHRSQGGNALAVFISAIADSLLKSSGLNHRPIFPGPCADNDVVGQCGATNHASLENAPRDLQILFAGLWISARVIVNENKLRCA